jgi:CheY-specific phosphatase CheX
VDGHLEGSVYCNLDNRTAKQGATALLGKVYSSTFDLEENVNIQAEFSQIKSSDLLNPIRRKPTSSHSKSGNQLKT